MIYYSIVLIIIIILLSFFLYTVLCLKYQIRHLKLASDNKNNDLAVIIQTLERENQVLNEKNYKLEKDNTILQAKSDLNESRIEDFKGEITRSKQHKDEISNLYEKYKSEVNNLREQYQEYIKQNSDALINRLEKSTAHNLESNSNKFMKDSKERLDVLLNPLKDKIEDFQKQTREYYSKELEGRTSLNTEIKLIAAESKRIADSCNNLSQILRGNQKIQGNWGELVLKKVLEASGLREGQEYHAQARMDNTDDNRAMVDILISLPDNRHIVVDAKTSLKHYEAYHNATQEDDKDKNLKSFLESIKNHIKNLSTKEYQQANNIKSPDFTVMFIPIDSAFILALQNDHALQDFALKNNIIISSPSLLIPILKTVNSLWQLSQQNANAQNIAAAAGDMYNKFCDFIKDMSKISTSIDNARKNYDLAFSKLYHGRGNLIKRAQDIKNMGVVTKSAKNISEEFLEVAELEIEEMIA